MSVLIGHASSSESGGKNGTKGDQTGKEVCTRNYYVYKGGWTYVLRPSPEIAEKSAHACESGTKNDKIGYGQADRNSLHTEAQRAGYDLAKITTPCNADCSSFMTICAIAAGVKSLEYTGNAPTTSTMKTAFSRTGKYEVLTDSKYLTSDKYLRRGDILVAAGHHTVMVLSNGSSGKKSIEEAAADVLKGLYGNNPGRKEKLKAEGFSDAEIILIQAEVNKSQTAKHVDKKGIDFLKQFEGCRLTAYKLKNETDGLYTIGYGHHGPDVLPNMTISQERAEEYLRLDLVKFENYVKQHVTDIVLTQNRLNALVSYCYNRGYKGLLQLAANCSTVKEYADGIVEYWGSNKAYKDALIKRRKAERELFLS